MHLVVVVCVCVWGGGDALVGGCCEVMWVVVLCAVGCGPFIGFVVVRAWERW
jgi:hypothetical protein